MLGLHQRIYCYRVSWQIITSIICGAKVAEICGLQDFFGKSVKFISFIEQLLNPIFLS
jgi:hypothetical protein